VTPNSRLHAPLREQRQLAPQQRVVEGRQAVARHVQLELHQRLQGVAHQRIGLGAGRARSRRRGRAVAQVVEQQEALASSRSSTAGACRPGAWIRPATCTNGRTSSCGGGASITMQLPAWPCTAGSGESWRRPTPVPAWPIEAVASADGAGPGLEGR
jgi:hypothetical protein